MLWTDIGFLSALWLPLTFAVMEHPSTLLWWAVRVDLLLVGLGSIGLFPALFAFRPGKRDLPFALALLGLTFFCLQTVVLDALVWPYFFPKGS